MEFQQSQDVMTLTKSLTRHAHEAMEQKKSLQYEQTFYTEQSFPPLKLDEQEQKARFQSYMSERNSLIQKSKDQHFSSQIKLNKHEQNAERKLFRLRNELYDQDPSIIVGDYYDKYQKLKSSKIYEALFNMPKPAIHHIHLTASVPVKFLIKLTYFDYVYMNLREMQIKVSKDPSTIPEGFIKMNTLRKHWQGEQDFDEFLKDKILLNKEDQGQGSKESHGIWDAFQFKFIMTNDLYNYYEFFERIIMKVFKVFIKQQVFAMEFKHILGMILDDQGKPLPLEQEISIFRRSLNKIKKDFPLFTIRLSIIALKLLGVEHSIKMIEYMKEGKKKLQEELQELEQEEKMSEQQHQHSKGVKRCESCYQIDKMTKQNLMELFSTYDLVSEEDQHLPLTSYLNQIIDEQNKNKDFQLVFHAGESCERANENLYDAILLNTKRIGHGFQLAQHPHLKQIVKDKKICIECCPVSNKVLGYVNDLRLHPARSFLHEGILVSISPDDPSFYDYEGVTLDYVYAFMAWELSLADLKQLCINSLEYAVITQDEKHNLSTLFHDKWKRFLEFVIGKF